jgi:chromosome segregation ATPase
MTEALQRQLRSENDQLRKQVNSLHEKLFKVKNQNKLLKGQSTTTTATTSDLQGQIQRLQQALQRERAEKEALKGKLVRRSSPMLSYNLTQDAVMSPQPSDTMLEYYRRPE